MRYTASRKYEIIQQLDSGDVTPEQIKAKHMLSSEELDEWTRLFYHNGIEGLRTTKLQNMEGRKWENTVNR